MNREYHKWFSPSLGRDMELLIFGHSGTPALVFPSSCGTFWEFEHFGMVEAVRWQIEAGRLRLFCVDSVDAESWYNGNVSPRWRIARHMQYEEYLLREVAPLTGASASGAEIVTVGCSFGGYHAANLALRHPERFRGFLAMSGIYDPTRFLRGYYDNNCYFHAPTHFVANMHDGWQLDRFRHRTFVLATGEHDICRGANEHMADVLRGKGIPHRLDIWGEQAVHDWPVWRRMLATYM